MIELTNINVNFNNRSVFPDQSIKIQNGILTSIIGKSGVGKTTLLDIIGLNTFDSETMIIDGTDLRKLKQQDVDQFKEDNIYFVKQTPKFFNDIRLHDYLNMYDYSLNNVLIELLELLELDQKLHLYPLQLSGGEKIKFSLILAYLSNAKIIILDEPTASVDNDSIDKIITMILKLVKKNTYVICATHNQKLIDLSKSVFKINDGKIVSITNNIDNHQSPINYDQHIVRPKNLIKTLLLSRIHHPTNIILKYTLISIIGAIALTSLFSNNYAAKVQEEIINDLGARELIIYKPIVESQRDYYNGRQEFPFTESELKSIENIDHIDRLAGYLVMTSNRSNDLNRNIIRKTNYTITKNNKIIVDYTIDLENGDGANTNSNYCDVSVYYPDEDYHQGGVYLSTGLANRLGYNYEDGTVLKTSINVPLYNIYNASYLVDENQNKIPTSDTIGTLVEIELPIYGVIENYPDWNTKYYNNTLFVSSEIYDKLILENRVNEGFEKNDSGTIKKYEPWQYNAYYLKIDSIANFEAVTSKLDELKLAYYSEYADAKQASNAINEQKNAMNLFSIIMVIALIIIAIIFGHIKKGDEADMIDYFKMVGLSKRAIYKIRFKNYLIDTTLIAILMLCLVFVVIDIYSLLHISYIKFELIMIPLIILISIIMNILIPLIITGKFYDKNR